MNDISMGDNDLQFRITRDITNFLASTGSGFYTGYFTPINGAYVFFVAAIFMGGTLACCKCW